ncbi:tetratricopeptide repeat protein [Colwellia sp. MEBiC06753]
MNKLSQITAVLLVVLSSYNVNANADLKTGIYELNRGQFKAAMTEFEPLLEEGYAPAQYQVGLMHKNGWGMKKDLNKAFELFSLAAEQNYPDAQFELALMYTEGEPVAKDSKKAFEYTQKAADKGLASAQFNLGVMYAEGIGTYRDNTKAFNEYQKAAKQNYALAQFNLALMYFEGKGTEKSLEQSYIWNTIASFNGYAPAENSRILDERKMGTADIQKAREKADSLYQSLLAQAELRAKSSD